MSRRTKGEGTITHRADGRWAAAISMGPGKGRRWGYFKTQGEASDWLVKTRKEIRDGRITRASTPKLGDFLDSWLEHVEGKGRRPKTIRFYRQMTDYIRPVLGTIRVDRLNVEDVERLLTRKSVTLSPRTVAHIRAVLRAALAHAVRRELVGRNVAALADVPSVPDREGVTFLTVPQARQLLEAAAGDPLEALYTVALAIGLRQGEALGLQWADVDLEGRVVHVRRQLQALPGRAPELAELKTRRSRRSIAIPGRVVAALLAHRERQMAAGVVPSGFVFADAKGRPLDAGTIRHRFYALLERAGLPRVRFHDLRASCASLLVAQGVHARVAQEILGHSSYVTTMAVYAKVAPETHREAADGIDRALGG